jgi:hypothetical protein
METVRGTCRDGTPRELSFWVKDGRLCLWMHRPDSGEKEGLEMIVAADDLFAALARALIGHPARVADDPGDPGR